MRYGCKVESSFPYPYWSHGFYSRGLNVARPANAPRSGSKEMGSLKAKLTTLS